MAATPATDSPPGCGKRLRIDRNSSSTSLPSSGCAVTSPVMRFFGIGDGLGDRGAIDQVGRAWPSITPVERSHSQAAPARRAAEKVQETVGQFRTPLSGSCEARKPSGTPGSRACEPVAVCTASYNVSACQTARQGARARNWRRRPGSTCSWPATADRRETSKSRGTIRER